MMYCKRDGHPIEVEDLLGGGFRFFDGLDEITSATPTITRCPSCRKPLCLADLLTPDEHLDRIDALAYAVGVQTAWAAPMVRAQMRRAA